MSLIPNGISMFSKMQKIINQSFPSSLSKVDSDPFEDCVDNRLLEMSYFFFTYFGFVYSKQNKVARFLLPIIYRNLYLMTECKKSSNILNFSSENLDILSLVKSKSGPYEDCVLARYNWWYHNLQEFGPSRLDGS